MQKMEQGEIPWHRPWHKIGRPMNYTSKKAYRGINIFLLSCAGFPSPYWLSFKQVKDLGGMVKKGEKGMPCIFWKMLKREEAETETIERIPILRYYTVFNSCQCEGLDITLPEARKQINPIEAAEKICREMPKRPEIKPSNHACYWPELDTVGMPEQKLFTSDEAYYATLFHELAHSTKHPDRLNRKGSSEEIQTVHSFGRKEYAREELVAEMTSAFLCGEAGILDPQIDNSAAYVQNWLKVFKNDKKVLIIAAAQAQKAADYILQANFSETKEE